MDALSFLEKHGKTVVERVAIAAGTNYAYYSQLAYGHRRPSVDLAEKLVEASTAEIPDPPDRLDLLGLLQRRERAA